MLQWMGGSRRKVTTSRKSAQKRQKQYFEQRKRQQLQATRIDDFSDGMHTSSQPQTNNRSLDILSLLNLPTVVQDHNSSCCSEARDNSEGGATTVNCHIATKCTPTIHNNKGTTREPIKFTEDRNPSGFQVETVYPKKSAFESMVLSTAFDCQNIDLLENDENADASVFELLGDDEPNDNLEGSLVHESHVAFSIEGLGKVGTETPVHSPQQPGRLFSYGSPSPLKAGRQPQSFKNLNNLAYDLELEAGALMRDINLSPSDNFLETPCYSRGIANSFSKSRHKLSSVKKQLQFNINASKLKVSFDDDDDIFCNIEDRNNDTWNDVNFFDENCGITWKKRPLKMDGGSADYWNLGNHEMSNFSFEGPYSQNSRVTERATGRFNISEPPASCSKQRRLQNDHDFSTPDGSWYPPVRRNRDMKDVTHAPGWSCYVTEDEGESLSLSEESCSSCAVREKTTKNPTSTSVARHNIRRHGSDIKSPVDKWGVEDIYTKDRHYVESFHDVNKINGPGNFTKMGNPSRLLPAHLSNSSLPKNLFPKDSLFEEGYISVDSNSGLCSFLQTSEAKIRTSSVPKNWNKDPFGSYSLPEFHADVESSLEISNHDVLHEKPSGNFSSEKLPFSEPYGHVNPYETPIFTTTGSGPSKLNLYLDSKVESQPQYSFPAVGSHGDTEVFHASVEESVAKDLENRSEETQQSEGMKFEVQKDICIGSNDLSSENEQPLAASVSKDNCSDCKEASSLTPEMDDRKITDSSELAKEISSSTKIPDKFEGSIDGKEYHNDGPTFLLVENGRRDSGSQETKPEGKGRSLDPSYQVMMLESYVLQLLCVQKVLKVASVQDTVKKV